MSNLALIANVTRGHWKPEISLTKQSQDLSFFCERGETNSNSAGWFQMNRTYDFVWDQMLRGDWEQDNSVTLKPRIFSHLQKLLILFLSQRCLKYPGWVFLPFIFSNTLWRRGNPQHSKHLMSRDIIFTYHVETCHLVWLLLVHARVLTVVIQWFFKGSLLNWVPGLRKSSKIQMGMKQATMHFFFITFWCCFFSFVCRIYIYLAQKCHITEHYVVTFLGLKTNLHYHHLRNWPKDFQ